MTYRLSRPAIQDIDTIAIEGKERFGPLQAAAYIDDMKRAFQLIATFPRANRARPELRPPQRVHRFGAHLVFYTIDKDDILITRIRHGREDWQAD